MAKIPPVENQWKAERERLASELQRLEEALADARSGSGDDEAGSLVSRLRDATRKRVRIEEEFERSSDRWREERRSLTDEIDQLDRALAKARADARQRPSAGKNEAPRLQKELADAVRANETLRDQHERDQAEWNLARESLESRIAQLEYSLVEALERANNGTRADEVREAALRAEVATHRQTIEAEVRLEFESALDERKKAVETLEEERARLHLEIHRLKEALQKPATPPAASEVDTPNRSSLFSLKTFRRKGKSRDDADPELVQRTRQLEIELSQQVSRTEEAIRRAEAAEADLGKLREQDRAGDGSDAANTLREELARERAAWDEQREGLGARIAELEAELESAADQSSSANQGNGDAESASEQWADERATLQARIAELEAALERAQEENGKIRADAGQSDTWKREREELQAEISRLNGCLVDAEQRISQDADGLAEAHGELEVHRKEIGELAGQLAESAKLWETERADLTARIHAADEAAEAARTHASGSEEAVSSLEAGLASSEAARDELHAQREADGRAWDEERGQLATRIQELELALTDARAEHSDVDHQYQQLLVDFEEARSRGNELRRQIDRNTKDWDEERAALQKQLKELQASLSEARNADASSDARAQALIADLEASERKLAALVDESGTERRALEASVSEIRTQLEESEQARANALRDLTTLQEESLSVTRELAAVREEFETASAQWNGDQGLLNSRVLELETSASELRTGLEESEKARENALRDLTALQEENLSVTRELAAVREEFEAASAQWSGDQDVLNGRIADLAAQVGELQEKITADQVAHEEGMAKSLDRDTRVREEFAAREQQISAEAEGLRARTAELEAALAESREQEQRERDELTTARDEARQALRSLEEEALAKSAAWEAERHQLEEAVNGLSAQLEEARQAASKSKALKASDSGSEGSVADLEARRQELELRLLESEEAREELAGALRAATSDWESERGRLEGQLGEMERAMETASKNEKADLDARHAALLEKLRAAESKYSSLEESSLQSARNWDEQRAQLEKEIGQWEAQIVAEAERVAEATRHALEQEYEKQLAELRHQKEQLESQLEGGAQPGPGIDADPALITSEMARVDAEIDEINQLIEDPDIALSNVMRKNAERSELKAYRRGLSYLAERIGQEQT